MIEFGTHARQTGRTTRMLTEAWKAHLEKRTPALYVVCPTQQHVESAERILKQIKKEYPAKEDCGLFEIIAADRARELGFWGTKEERSKRNNAVAIFDHSFWESERIRINAQERFKEIFMDLKDF